MSTLELRLAPVSAEDYEWMYELESMVYGDVVVRQFGTWDEEFQRRLFEQSFRPDLTQKLLLGKHTIGILTVEYEEGWYFIHEIQLLPEFQGRGIGTKILERLLAEARRSSVPIRLQVLHENHRARKLYERLGFSEAGQREHHRVMESR